MRHGLDDLSEYHIRKIAEAYFKDRGDEFQGKPLMMPSGRYLTDLKPSNFLHLIAELTFVHIAAEEIPSRIERVCRFLRTSHGMDISCIDFQLLRQKQEKDLSLRKQK